MDTSSSDLLDPEVDPDSNSSLSESVPLSLDEVDNLIGVGFGVGVKKVVSSGLKKSVLYQNLRHQLQEQLKSLEARLEAQLQATGELSDYFRRRSDLEGEFSKSLDKMWKNVNFKRKDSSVIGLSGAGGGPWAPQMLSSLMVNMLADTKKEARERGVVSEICGLIVNRLGLISEDLNRIFKQCHSVCLEGQEELVKVLQELYISSKAYTAQASEYKASEQKLKAVELQKSKAEAGLSREKIEKSKKLKGLEKEVTKRSRKASDLRFKTMKAKNEYILCMDAANAAVQKYFVEDLSDLIDCMDLGYYEAISSVLKLYVFSEDIKKESLGQSIESLGKLLGALDSRVDKQKFLEAHNSAFVLPKKFEFGQFLHEPEDPPPTALEIPPILQEELEQRMYLLERRLCTLKIESNELWKTLETAESTLLSLIDENFSMNVVREWFAVGSISSGLLSDGKEGSIKSRSDRMETDQFHINKYRDWMLATSRVARLDAKYDTIKLALGVKRSSMYSGDDGSDCSEKLKRRKRIGQRITSAVRLFGGSIEEYLEVNKVEIPLIVKSCVRVVNLFGLHHQGIFRVSGSQVEINNFRDAFERGEDPLCELTDASDINSVASLLKLYLRELREPLFPIVFFDFFMEVAQLDSDALFVQKMRELVTKSLPRPVFIVLRYLFHFLNHLSEYSEENMMDPHNLAVCFGPTLVPVPDDKDQVQYQNLVNELIKRSILFAHDIFSNEAGGEIYKKYSDREFQIQPAQAHCSYSHSHARSSSNLTTLSASTDSESELSLCAHALYDFKSRSARELTLKKGQNLRLTTRVSSDWWKGYIDGTDAARIGLIPHKYIQVEGGATPPPSRRRRTPSAEPKPPATPTELRDRPLKLLVNVSCKPEEELQSEPKPDAKPSTSEASNRLSLETKFTPDLVMDLPPQGQGQQGQGQGSANSTDTEAKSSESPESSSDESEVTVVTGAEVFAKQNQCTLKKLAPATTPGVPTKPKVMAKPKLPKLQVKEEDEDNEGQREEKRKD